MAAKYHAIISTPHGPRKGFQAATNRDSGRTLIARFGDPPLRRRKDAVLIDRQPTPGATRRKELIGRLLAGRCEICQHNGQVQAHHVRKLADLDKPGRPQPGWANVMAKRRRKTLVVCQPCHHTIHTGRPSAITTL
jgi:hypothetical protein